MKKSRIKKIKAREILDSRGNPTIEVDLETELGVFRASVPSGTSKGKYEAVELRDGGKKYQGLGVQKAVRNINEIIGPKLIDKDPRKQKEIDEMLIKLDGTKNKSKLGANAILAISLALARAGAEAKKIPLWQHIGQFSDSIPPTFPDFRRGSSVRAPKFRMPVPCFLMIEGGLHAGNDLDIQEFMIAPETNSFKEMLQIGAEIYHTLGAILKKRYGPFSTNSGLEGGFAAPLRNSEEALNLIMLATEKAGYKNKVKIILDVAASIFYQDGVYKFEGGVFTKGGFLNFYSELFKKYPILAIEDPFSQDDWQGFKIITQKFGKKISVLGDDFLVTNIARIKRAQTEKACNGLILKPNQIGTLTETIEAANLARSFGWKIMVSHRSGETSDDFISDFAVGILADFIKAGAPARGERVAKYNRLLRIEEEISG